MCKTLKWKTCEQFSFFVILGCWIGLVLDGHSQDIQEITNGYGMAMDDHALGSQYLPEGACQCVR